MGRRPQGAIELKVRVASIGRDRSGLFAPAVAEYARRLSHYAGFSLLELAESRRSGLQGVEEEGKRLGAALAPRDWLIALDERGEPYSSLQLSQLLSRAQAQGKDLLFAVGGDEGLSPELIGQAKLTLSLSRLTLPHRLARLLLVEQLYRAFTILRGEPYHK